MPTIRNGGKWTEARFKSFVVSALRAAFRRWPPKYQVLKNAATKQRINPKSGRMAMHYKCAKCKQEFPQKEIQVDHKKPVVEKTGFMGWNTYIERMYVEASALQVLCKPCHKKKTLREKAERIGINVQDTVR